MYTSAFSSLPPPPSSSHRLNLKGLLGSSGSKKVTHNCSVLSNYRCQGVCSLVLVTGGTLPGAFRFLGGWLGRFNDN